MAMSNIPTPQKTFPFVNIFPHDLFRMQGSQIFVHSLSCMFAFCMSGGSHSQDTRDQTLSDLWGLTQKGAFYFLVCFLGGGARWQQAEKDRVTGQKTNTKADFICVVERGLEVWHWSAVTTIRSLEEPGIGQWHSGTDQWSVPLGVLNTVVCPVVLAKWLLSGQSLSGLCRNLYSKHAVTLCHCADNNVR